MRKYCEENERIKHAYLRYMRHANRKDEQTLDKIAAALANFEKSTNFKPFKQFHIKQAIHFKAHLDKARNANTGKPLSHSTKDAALRLLKAFFKWLAWQPGYRSRINFPDVEYFNNNAKDARVAHARREIPFPSIEAAIHAFSGMPDATELQRRDKAVFAFFMLTGARDGAVASLKLKHINLFDGSVFQDGREVKTKNGATFTTWFYPVGPAYLACFKDWVEYLRTQKLFGGEDALFPKLQREHINGCFVYKKLSRDCYAGSYQMNKIVRNAFAMVQLPEYTAHSFRKTHGVLMSDLRLTVEEQKAWSQNLGHKYFHTTVSSYLPVSEPRQGELIRSLR